MAPKEGNVYVDLKTLPDFTKLRSRVQQVVDASSWWEMYGVDWLVVLAALSAWPIGLLLLADDSLVSNAFGMAVLGFIHSVFSIKAGHAAAHGAMAISPGWNKLWTYAFIELIGSFSAHLGYTAHILSHHPHTNIIGLGDSAMWKVPFLPKYIYMFLAPLVLPCLTPIFAVANLWEFGAKRLIRSACVITLGLTVNFWLLVNISGFSFPGAVLVTFGSRAILSIPYIHVNIFQHIGLPMYSQDHRPKRIYQMSTAVLNLPRNPILDWCFGHSIISCHVEHHLFPKLSDNMCLKIKPAVRQFLLDNNLPYKEDTYVNRLQLFLDKYQEIMVDAPPITHFIGIQ